MRGMVLALTLIVVACSSSSAPMARSSPPATVMPSPAALDGDLPVWVGLGSGDDSALANPQVAGGFIHFPGGVFRRDPRADMLRDRTIPTLVRTKTPDQPYLYAGEGSPVQSVQITFDRVVGRWLPVNRTQVSDDGLRYAYIDYESGVAIPRRIHVVDVRSGSDQVVYRDTNKPLFALAGLAQQNIYLTDCEPTETSGNCWGPLRRLDVTTGNVTQVSDRRGAWVISGRIAWIETCWPAKYPVPCFGTYDERGPNQLLRIDLASGNEEIWDRGSAVHLIGIDGDGMPLVAGNSATESVLFRVSAPEQKERLFSIAISQPWAGFESATADRVGTWLQATYVPPGFQTSVLYLYSKASGGQEISHDFRAVPVGSFG